MEILHCITIVDLLKEIPHFIRNDPSVRWFVENAKHFCIFLKARVISTIGRNLIWENDVSYFIAR